MDRKGTTLCVLAVVAALVTSASAGGPAFTVVYNNLDATQTNILTQYAKAINIGGAQTVVEGAFQSNTAAGPGVGNSKVTFNNVDAYQTNALQQVAFALNFAGSQTVIQSAYQSNNGGRRLLTGPPEEYTVSFNDIQEYQKNFLAQAVNALNLGGQQTVAQTADQGNTASTGAPKYTLAVNHIDITQINIITQLAIAINVGGTQTVIQNAIQGNTAGK